MVYYLGTSSDVPLIPFDERAPALNVTEVEPAEEQAVRGHLASPYAHYIGSSTSCGCNFRCDAFGDPYAQKDAADVQADHEALATYLESLPREADPIRIFSSWSGDESIAPEHSRSCPVDDLRAPDFTFREGELINVTR
jgi:hypothetical protein